MLRPVWSHECSVPACGARPEAGDGDFGRQAGARLLPVARRPVEGHRRRAAAQGAASRRGAAVRRRCGGRRGRDSSRWGSGSRSAAACGCGRDETAAAAGAGVRAAQAQGGQRRGGGRDAAAEPAVADCRQAADLKEQPHALTEHRDVEHVAASVGAKITEVHEQSGHLRAIQNALVYHTVPCLSTGSLVCCCEN